jgi:hypothetical protein
MTVVRPAEPIARRPNVLERNIDAMLFKRLGSDQAFGKSLIHAIAAKCRVTLLFDKIGVEQQARHHGANGTIDLLIRLFGDAGGEVGCILIENKLDSSFTPNQPERYASSAVAMSRRGKPALPIVFAPAEYIKKSKYLGPFKAVIAYEELAGWLDGDDRTLIEAAILRFAMPYEPDPVPEVREFHEGYKQLIGELAPEIIVKPNPNTRDERPEGSRTIYFVTKRSLPNYDFLPTLKFSHQCWDSSAPSPSVKIMFTGWGGKETILRSVAAETLGNTGLYLRKATGSLGLVRDTPRLDNKRPVSAQMEAVITGIRAAAMLGAWMCANEIVLRQWASAVEGNKR